MTDPQIRQAGADDARRICAILREAEAWLRLRGTPMWLPQELEPERLWRDVAAGMHYVAELEGEIVGCLRFQLEDPEYWPDLPNHESAFVHRLAVPRRYAGTGVASALLDWAADRTEELGRAFVRLDCDRDRPRLRAFYERNGFRHHSDRQVGQFYVARYERPVP